MRKLKNFIIASFVFIAFSFLAIIIDALCDWSNLIPEWETMPNIFYYAFGWLASGISVVMLKGE